jgi:hypothetical protein
MNSSPKLDRVWAPRKREGLALFMLGLLVLIPTEIWCVQSALETQGEVMQAMLWTLFLSNAIWICLGGWFPRAASVGLLATALTIIPYQVFLLERLTRLNTEMMQFVDARLRLRAEGKPIPATLDDYEFSHPKMKRFIYSYKIMDDGKNFFLAYFVVQPGITHSYDSKTGWFYYPD